MSTIATVIAGWFGFSIVLSLLIGRGMSFAKRNDPLEMPLLLPAPRAYLPMAHKPAMVPVLAYAPRKQRRA
jgi:hypothetical protein